MFNAMIYILKAKSKKQSSGHYDRTMPKKSWTVLSRKVEECKKGFSLMYPLSGISYFCSIYMTYISVFSSMVFFYQNTRKLKGKINVLQCPSVNSTVASKLLNRFKWMRCQ